MYILVFPLSTLNDHAGARARSESGADSVVVFVVVRLDDGELVRDVDVVHQSGGIHRFMPLGIA